MDAKENNPSGAPLSFREKLQLQLQRAKEIQKLAQKDLETSKGDVTSAITTGASTIASSIINTPSASTSFVEMSPKKSLNSSSITSIPSSLSQSFASRMPSLIPSFRSQTTTAAAAATSASKSLEPTVSPIKKQESKPDFMSRFEEIKRRREEARLSALAATNPSSITTTAATSVLVNNENDPKQERTEGGVNSAKKSATKIQSDAASAAAAAQDASPKALTQIDFNRFRPQQRFSSLMNSSSYNRASSPYSKEITPVVQTHLPSAGDSIPMINHKKTAEKIDATKATTENNSSEIPSITFVQAIETQPIMTQPIDSALEKVERQIAAVSLIVEESQVKEQSSIPLIESIQVEEPVIAEGNNEKQLEDQNSQEMEVEEITASEPMQMESQSGKAEEKQIEVEELPQINQSMGIIEQPQSEETAIEIEAEESKPEPHVEEAIPVVEQLQQQIEEIPQVIEEQTAVQEEIEHNNDATSIEQSAQEQDEITKTEIILESVPINQVPEIESQKVSEESPFEEVRQIEQSGEINNSNEIKIVDEETSSSQEPESISTQAADFQLPTSSVEVPQEKETEEVLETIVKSVVEETIPERLESEQSVSQNEQIIQVINQTETADVEQNAPVVEQVLNEPESIAKESVSKGEAKEIVEEVLSLPLPDIQEQTEEQFPLDNLNEQPSTEQEVQIEETENEKDEIKEIQIEETLPSLAIQEEKEELSNEIIEESAHQINQELVEEKVSVEEKQDQVIESEIQEVVQNKEEEISRLEVIDNSNTGSQEEIVKIVPEIIEQNLVVEQDEEALVEISTLPSEIRQEESMPSQGLFTSFSQRMDSNSSYENQNDNKFENSLQTTSSNSESQEQIISELPVTEQVQQSDSNEEQVEISQNLEQNNQLNLVEDSVNQSDQVIVEAQQIENNIVVDTEITEDDQVTEEKTLEKEAIVETVQPIDELTEEKAVESINEPVEEKVVQSIDEVVEENALESIDEPVETKVDESLQSEIALEEINEQIQEPVEVTRIEETQIEQKIVAEQQTEQISEEFIEEPQTVVEEIVEVQQTQIEETKEVIEETSQDTVDESMEQEEIVEAIIPAVETAQIEDKEELVEYKHESVVLTEQQETELPCVEEEQSHRIETEVIINNSAEQQEPSKPIEESFIQPSIHVETLPEVEPVPQAENITSEETLAAVSDNQIEKQSEQIEVAEDVQDEVQVIELVNEIPENQSQEVEKVKTSVDKLEENQAEEKEVCEETLADEQTEKQVEEDKEVRLVEVTDKTSEVEVIQDVIRSEVDENLLVDEVISDEQKAETNQDVQITQPQIEETNTQNQVEQLDEVSNTEEKIVEEEDSPIPQIMEQADIELPRMEEAIIVQELASAVEGVVAESEETAGVIQELNLVGDIQEEAVEELNVVVAGDIQEQATEEIIEESNFSEETQEVAVIQLKSVEMSAVPINSEVAVTVDNSETLSDIVKNEITIIQTTEVAQPNVSATEEVSQQPSSTEDALTLALKAIKSSLLAPATRAPEQIISAPKSPRLESSTLEKVQFTAAPTIPTQILAETSNKASTELPKTSGITSAMANSKLLSMMDSFLASKSLSSQKPKINSSAESSEQKSERKIEQASEQNHKVFTPSKQESVAGSIAAAGFVAQTQFSNDSFGITPKKIDFQDSEAAASKEQKNQSQPPLQQTNVTPFSALAKSVSPSHSRSPSPRPTKLESSKGKMSVQKQQQQYLDRPSRAGRSPSTRSPVSSQTQPQVQGQKVVSPANSRSRSPNRFTTNRKQLIQKGKSDKMNSEVAIAAEEEIASAISSVSNLSRFEIEQRPEDEGQQELTEEEISSSKKRARATLNEELARVTSLLGVSKLNKNQLQIIDAIYGEDKNISKIMLNQSGKNILYQTLAMMEDTLPNHFIVVVTTSFLPLRSKMNKQISWACINSLMSVEVLVQVQNLLMERKIKLLFIQQEHLMQDSLRFLKNRIKMIFFEDQTEKISDIVSQYNIKRVHLFHTTCFRTKEHLDSISQKYSLTNLDSNVSLYGFDFANMHWTFETEKEKSFINFIRKNNLKKVIMYIDRSKKIDEIVSSFNQKGLKMHAFNSAKVDTTLSLFAKDSFEILCCYNGQVIPKSLKSLVQYYIHYHLPRNILSYLSDMNGFQFYHVAKGGIPFDKFSCGFLTEQDFFEIRSALVQDFTEKKLLNLLIKTLNGTLEDANGNGNDGKKKAATQAITDDCFFNVVLDETEKKIQDHYNNLMISDGDNKYAEDEDADFAEGANVKHIQISKFTSEHCIKREMLLKMLSYLSTQKVQIMPFTGQISIIQKGAVLGNKMISCIMKNNLNKSNVNFSVLECAQSLEMTSQELTRALRKLNAEKKIQYEVKEEVAVVALKPNVESMVDELFEMIRFAEDKQIQELDTMYLAAKLTCNQTLEQVFKYQKYKETNKNLLAEETSVATAVSLKQILEKYLNTAQASKELEMFTSAADKQKLPFISLKSMREKSNLVKDIMALLPRIAKAKLPDFQLNRDFSLMDFEAMSRFVSLILQGIDAKNINEFKPVLQFKKYFRFDHYDVHNIASEFLQSHYLQLLQSETQKKIKI